MAVQIFKDGESRFVDPKRLHNHLECGWSVQDPSQPGSLQVSNPSIDLPDDASQEEAEAQVLEEMGITNPEPTKRTTQKSTTKRKPGRPKKSSS